MTPDDEQRRKIAECVAAMGALQDQLCGMFAALEQQEKAAAAGVSGISTETAKLAAEIAAVPGQISSGIQTSTAALLSAVRTQMQNQIVTGLGAAVTEAQGKVAASVAGLNTSIKDANAAVEKLKNTAAQRWWMALLLPAVVAVSVAACGFGLQWWVSRLTGQVQALEATKTRLKAFKGVEIMEIDGKRYLAAETLGKPVDLTDGRSAIAIDPK